MSLKRDGLPWILQFCFIVGRVLPERVKQALYHLPLLSVTLRRLLTRVAPSHRIVVQVAGGLLDRSRLLLDLKKEKYYWLGVYELQLQEAVKDFIRPGMVVYDVGANIGYLALIFARHVGEKGCVYAFEPLPENVSRLEAHITMNSQNSVVTVIPCAVSEKNETAVFQVHDSHAMGKLFGSSGRESAYCDSIDVQCVSLDDFVYGQGHLPPNVVKIDIEGGEIKAVPGMRRLLKEERPILFLELHGPKAVEIVCRILKECSYRIHRIAPGYPEVSSFAQMEWKELILGYPENGTTTVG